jgi:hypothetical protein
MDSAQEESLSNPDVVTRYKAAAKIVNSECAIWVQPPRPQHPSPIDLWGLPAPRWHTTGAPRA